MRARKKSVFFSCPHLYQFYNNCCNNNCNNSCNNSSNNSNNSSNLTLSDHPHKLISYVKFSYFCIKKINKLVLRN